jgi:hypothetical protein
MWMAGPSPQSHGLIAGAKKCGFTAWSNSGQVVIYRGVEYSVTATGEPDVWQWRFQIGDKTTTGKTRTRLIRLANRRVKPLFTICAITREAPLASLFVAFLFDVAGARRR